MCFLFFAAAAEYHIIQFPQKATASHTLTPEFAQTPSVARNIENRPISAIRKRPMGPREGTECSIEPDSVCIPLSKSEQHMTEMPITKHTGHNANKQGKSNAGKTEKQKHTSSIKIIFAQRKEKAYVQELLQNDLVTLIPHIEEIQYDECEAVTCAIVYFYSSSEAEKALQILQTENREYTVALVAEANPFLLVDVENLRTKVDREHKSYLEEHDEKIKCLEEHFHQLKSRKQYLPLEEYERISQERCVLKLKINEYQQQRKEFEDFVQLHLDSLSSLCVQSEVSVLKMELAREYSRFSKALPIYARRSEIVQTIYSNNVTVLVGETGSGKSTQVVQYLYEAGIAQHGLLVCTQPRKVAAITLAQHVSREMQVKLGEELGYRVGMNEKCCLKTKILYMTDHILLNECIADQTLSKYSCVVVDEAHERSLNTDMLLAFLKQCLPTRRDLKVVIMSATIEPKLFVNYFEDASGTQQITRVSTIMVSGRTFPVEVEYDPLHSEVPLSSDNKYVLDAVDVAKRIHTNEPPGDILVFLTCAPEIERACRAMDCLGREATILPLHGKLPPDEQQRVFEDYGNKRKIIFATNVAETSVTIPGVKYVVDTGLAKEMHFEPHKNMDSLEVRLISKSSAEQRKGRAGRMSAGKCYRLYTEEDYASKMPDRSKPEILRIQLTQVVLKLLEFGVPNVLTFDFVEHPDSDALKAAVETLSFVGAIRDNALTDVGEKMAALPIAPQLAKVLLEGVTMGLGAEALTSVALSSLAGQVFFRGGTEEMKEESDKMKLKFCHPMGDQMTRLSVYQCWQEQKTEERTKWCLENYVNAKSMRIAEETIKELRHILRHKLKVEVPLKLQSLEAADCYLCKLYFYAFLTNLAVYLGHEQAGYMTTKISSGSFVMFPGSSLRQLNLNPRYVIYEKTLKTSQQFLTQVMHVKQEWVDEAVRIGKLSEDPAKTFSDYMVTPFHVIAVGPQIYRHTMMRKKELLDLLTINIPASAMRPVIDFSTYPKQWGIVRAFTQKQYQEAIKVVVTQVVREKQAEFEGYTREFGVTREDSTRLVIGTGGNIQQVNMPFQFCTVVAVCSKESPSVDLLKSELLKYGEVKNTKVIANPKEFRLSVTYSTSNAAQRALTECNIDNVTLRPWKGQQFTLKLQWERRQRGSFAFLAFDSPLHCVEAYQCLLNNMLHCGRRITVRYDKYKQTQLFLSGDILSTCDEDDLRVAIQRYLTPNIKSYLKMGYKKWTRQEHFYQDYSGEEESDTDSNSEEDANNDHNSLLDEYEEHTSTDIYKKEMEMMITAVVEKYIKAGRFAVEFIVPKQWDIFFRARVTFNHADEGYKVLHSRLKQEYIDGKLLTVCPDLKCSITLQKEIYLLIKDVLENIQSSLLQQYMKVLRIKIFPPNKDKNVAHVLINANDVKAFAVAQKQLNLAAEPLVLHCNTTELHEYILCQTCTEELQIIESKTSMFLRRDLNTMAIKIYGNRANQKSAMDMINDKAMELFSEGAQVIKISLRDRGIAGLMKSVVSKYGYDLSGMLELEGVRRVSLNPRQQLISLLATATGKTNVEECIEELSSLTQVSLTIRNSEYAFDCSACLTPIEESKDLLRLECCGHAFHTECIAVQMKSDTLIFPVKCASEGCSKSFMLKDFENLQKRLKFRMSDLVSMSLRNYMEKNGDVYKNCPTPDCKMIYVKTEESREFVCGSCSISICTKCHEQYHAGISCEVYKLSQKSDQEVKEWMEEDPDNRTKCPQCSCLIEKNDGCMHMHCVCGGHICWRCMKLFNSDTHCYNHQGYCLALHQTPVRPPIMNPAPRPAPPTVNPAPRPAPPTVNPAPRPAPPTVNPTPRPAASNRPGNDSSCHIL